MDIDPSKMVAGAEAEAKGWLARPVPRWWLGVAVAAGLVAGWLL